MFALRVEVRYSPPYFLLGNVRQVHLNSAQRSCAAGKGKFSFLPLIHTHSHRTII